MKNFNLAFLLALLVVLTSVTVRRSVGGFGTSQSSLAPLGMIAIGTSPAPLPPSPGHQIGTSPAPLPPSPKPGAGLVPFAPIS